MTVNNEKKVIVGKLGTSHGVKGWLKIHSFTDPETQIFDYLPWQLSTKDGHELAQVTDKRIDGTHLLVKFEGCDDRDVAKTWTNREIVVLRSQLPDADDGEYYWSDLEGLSVIRSDGLTLGQVDHLYNAGASDIMVLNDDKMQQIPFIMQEVVKTVDLQQQQIIVDWQIDNDE